MTLEERVVGLLSRDREKKNISQIADALGEHYSYVHRKVKELGDKDVLKIQRTGNTLLCEPDFDNDRTRALLHMNEVKRRDGFYSRNKKLALALKDFVENVKNKANFVVLFGSYAKGNAGEESDIDLYLLTEEDLDISQTVKEIRNKYGKEISAVQSTPEGWRKDRKKPIGSEIIKNRVILYGFEDFIREVYG